MSARSKSSTKRASHKVITRPFGPEILDRARQIASRYQIVLWTAEGEYYGRGVELPLSMGDGKTPDECVANTREALVVTVAYLLEKGGVPPSPASEGKRDQQVNVRLTSE